VWGKSEQQWKSDCHSSLDSDDAFAKFKFDFNVVGFHSDFAKFDLDEHCGLYAS
jgi:hypothetical protein